MNTTTYQPMALEIMVKQFRAPVYSFLYSRAQDSAVAERLTREAIQRLVQKLPRLRADDRLESWVVRIVRNTLVDHLRTNAQGGTAQEYRLLEAQARGEIDTPAWEEQEEELLRNSVRNFIRGVVEALPEIYRVALMLSEYEGLTQVELAERLNIPISTARTRVQRARHKVKNIIELCCFWEADGRAFSLEKALHASA